MSSIYDRGRAALVDLSHIGNLKSHSLEVASVCAWVSTLAYALVPDAGARSVEWIPHRELAEALAGGSSPPSAAAWFRERDYPIFTVAVPGGGALGVRIGDTILLGFRGTTNGDDWRQINFFTGAGVLPLKVPVLGNRYWPWERGQPMAHGGFYGIARMLAAAAAPEIAKWRGMGAERLLLCGHSLGGALALLAGSELEDVDSIYSYGAPKVGSADLIQYLPESHFRYVFAGDPVPATPPLMDFVHGVPAVMLRHGGPSPGVLGKLLKGWSKGRTKGALANLFAAEHDLGLYASTIDAMLAQGK